MDGQDSQSFPTQLDLANNIEGPLEITGGMTDDRSADLEREPVMLLGETNFKPEIGSVKDADSFTVTIDINEAVDGVATTATLTQGDSAGVIKIVTNTDGRTSPPDPSNANEVQLLTIDAVSGWFRLGLDIDENDAISPSETTADIEFNPEDPVQVASDIKDALETLAGITIDEVVASGSAYLIKFATPANTDLRELVPYGPTTAGHHALTKVGVVVEGYGGSSTDREVVQNLAIYGNAGTFSLEVEERTAGNIPFDPKNPDQKDGDPGGDPGRHRLGDIRRDERGSSSPWRVRAPGTR